MDLEDLKAFAVVITTGVMEHLLHNPIGSVSAVIGVLYLYQKWQTQLALRKKAEKEIEDVKIKD